MYPLDYIEFDVRLELIQSINKGKDLPSIVNQIPIETINMLWTRIKAKKWDMNWHSQRTLLQ